MESLDTPSERVGIAVVIMQKGVGEGTRPPGGNAPTSASTLRTGAGAA